MTYCRLIVAAVCGVALGGCGSSAGSDRTGDPQIEAYTDCRQATPARTDCDRLLEEPTPTAVAPVHVPTYRDCIAAENADHAACAKRFRGDALDFISERRASAWKRLSAEEKALVVGVFLRDVKRSELVSLRRLVRAADRLRQPASRGMKSFLRAALVEVQTDDQARKDRAYAERQAEILGNRRAVGMTMDQIRRALGPPEHDQNIGGMVLWYYGGGRYQLVFENGVVAQQNDY